VDSRSETPSTGREPCRALGWSPSALSAESSFRRPFTRCALPLRASPAHPTSSRNRKWSCRTDAAYRLLQPSESMSTPRERLFLAQNPLFQRIPLGRNFRYRRQRAARFPELTLRAPEGKTAPACRAKSQHARRSRSGRLVTTCRAPFVVRRPPSQGLVNLLR